jgi:hypothetical protein
MSAEKEIIELIKSLISNEQIGLIGVRNNNGADYYRCPACSSCYNTHGHADSSAHLDNHPSGEECDLVKLHRLLSHAELFISDRLRELSKYASAELASLIETAANSSGQSQVDAIAVSVDLATEKGE